MLEKKMVAVANIVETLETSFANHKWNETLTGENVHFHNAKNITNIELTYMENFNTDVNTNVSAVQIPTDIWDEDLTILNGVIATNPIDKAFRDNYAQDPQLLWQYFGSADGFYRSFPAAAWVAEDPTKDQYDVRRRGWYIQAASSPKNVMILIDTSGSTYGLTLEIIKVSVSKALDTLGNDDFVNVAYFNSDVSPVSCFETFVQANLRNKDKLKEAVLKLNATRIANFHDALEYSFEQFSDFEKMPRQLNQGANCHQAILIFTDGGEDTEQEVFEKWNRPLKTRVFVYNVGSDSMVSPAGVKAMACDNKGYFSNIKSFGAVRLTTLDYVPVLSRPMVLSRQKHFQWSDIYLDALGLGMMTTLTRPVYNKTKPLLGEPENQQMLGVVGTDITTKNMEETVPKKKIGPEGYAFGINSNGYILLHPRLKAEKRKLHRKLTSHGDIDRDSYYKLISQQLGYLSEPPNVDFLEVEFDTPDKRELRKKMIDSETGNQTLTTPVMSRDERYVETVNMTYSYTNIENTTFSVAIAQPSFGLYEYNITNVDVNLQSGLGYFMGAESSKDFILIAPWEFCSGLMEGNASTADIASKLQDEINKAQGLKDPVVLATCDTYLVKKLFIDAEITKELLDEWEKDWENINGDGVIYQMVATQGGITRIHPKSVPDTWSEAEIEKIQDPWEQAYYQRALYSQDFVFSVPYKKPSDADTLSVNATYLSNITSSKALKMDKDVTPAVLVAVFDPKIFNDMWIEHTRKGFNNKHAPLSCADEELRCYILDDGGFIIATNQMGREEQNQVGMFFGEVDGDIMSALTNKSFYDRIETIDYQAACPRHSQTGSAAPRSINIPTITDMFNFNYWIVTAFWAFIRHTLYDMFIFGMTDFSMINAEDVAIPENVSCIKLQKQYYYSENASLGADGDFVCRTNCTRKWASTRIEGTNLVLVLTRQPDCDVSECPNQKVTQEAEEPPPDKIPNPCEVEPWYRRRPSEYCYDYHLNESDICSSASVTHPSLVLLIFHTMFVLVGVMISSYV